MSRSIEEWIGKNDDAPVPPRVKARVFLKYDGHCYLSGRKILPGDAWDLEHIIALCNGGLHAESNFAPALKDAHKAKTKADRTEKKIIDRKRRKHLGISARKSRPMAGTKESGLRKRMNGEVERR